MRNWLHRLRVLGGANDRAHAFESETTRMDAALAVPTLDPRFVKHMRELDGGSAIHLGRTRADPATRVSLALPDIAGSGHALVLGANGTGKTRVVAGVVRELLRRRARGVPAPGIWITDHKSEFIELARELFAEIVDAAPPGVANALVDQFVVLNPFSDTALVPMQVLEREPGVPDAIHAHDVTSLIDRIGGADLGIKQDAFLFHLVLLGITRGASLPELAALARDPVALVSAAAGSTSSEVRDYFSGNLRLAQSSLDGVNARLHRLLRLPQTRLMLGAKGSLSFKKLLANKVVFVDVGSPPLGCEDIGRFWSGLVTLKLGRAIFDRKPEEAKPVAVFVDEWQEGLMGGSDVIESYERTLSMARSRGVSLWLISQSLAGAAKVSSSLPKMVATNTNVQLLFRSSIEDARAMAHLFHVTGRRPRPVGAPWEERAKSPFVTPADELQQLTAEASSLPDRTFLMWNRRQPYRAELVVAADVAPASPGFRSKEVAWRLSHGALARPSEDLRAAATPSDKDEAAFRPAAATPRLAASEPAPRRRRRPRPE